MVNKTDISLNTIISKMRELDIFKKIPTANLAEIAELAVPLFFKPGQTIFREDDILHSVYVIVDGRVKIYKQTSGGRFIALDILSQGALGDVSVFAEQPCAVAAEAMDDVVLLSFSLETMLKVINKNPTVAIYIIVGMAKRGRIVEDAITDMLSYGATNRVVKVLCMMNNEFGSTLIVSHQDVADMAGTTRETASRVLEKMKTEGIVDYKKDGKLHILNCNNLERFR